MGFKLPNPIEFESNNMGNTNVSPNMKKVREYIDKDGNKLDNPKGQVIKKKETFNINDVPKDELKEVEDKAEDKKDNIQNKIDSKIESKLDEIINKKIDEALNKML